MSTVEAMLVGLLLSACVDPDGPVYDWEDPEIGIQPGQWDEMVAYWHRLTYTGWVSQRRSCHAWGVL